MHHQNILYLAAAGLATCTAAGQKLQPGLGFTPVGGLLARQDSGCTTRSTCAECYGEGYVVCDMIGCFNPDIHQQCCKNALLCVGRTNNCCKDWGGPGITGTAGVPNVTARPAAPTDAPEDTTSFTCVRGDEGEECCQRAAPPLHWCSGEFPNFRCYNDKNQWCCSEGTVCDEEGCCELFNASAVQPWAATVTQGPSSTGTTTGDATDATSGAADAAGTTDAPESAATTSTSGVEPTPGAGFVAIGLAALGLGLL